MHRWGLSFPFEGVPLPAHRDILLQAESLGYTDAWTPEVSGADAFLPLALAAAWSPSLRLGSAVANVFTRGPALLAMTIAALAETAPGRLSIGLGTSTPLIVQGWNGIRHERPLSRIRETVDFIRRVMSGEKTASAPLGIQGFRLARQFAQVPPILIAALRPRMLALAGEVGDGVVIGWLSPEDVPKVVDVVKTAAVGAGRDPDQLEIVCSIPVLAMDDEAAALELGRRLTAAYLTTPVYGPYQSWLGRGEILRPIQEAWDAGDRKTAASRVPEELVRELLLLGSPEECLSRVDSFVKNGVTLPILEFTPTASEEKERAEQSLRLMEVFARR